MRSVRCKEEADRECILRIVGELFDPDATCDDNSCSYPTPAPTPAPREPMLILRFREMILFRL